MRSWVASISGLIAFATTSGSANGPLPPVNAGFLPSTVAQTLASKSAPSILDIREKSLAWLPGRFIVVGQEPDSGRTYHGSVSVTRQGERLLIQKNIQGELISGTGTIVFEPETPVLEVAYRVGSHTITAGYEFRSGDQDQPRASGWVSPVDGDLAHRNRLGLEAWYYDRAPTASPPSILNQSTKKRHDTADDRLGLFEGKFRVIGQEIGSGRIYTGRITAKPDGGILKISGTINGKVSVGELILSDGDHFSLVAKYRSGNEWLGAILNEQTVGDNYPRLCGYFYSVSGKVIFAAGPRLETWFYDW